ncbi:MAG TPA: hypothetical protein VGI17_00135 [Solirubrobacterales bacterium]
MEERARFVDAAAKAGHYESFYVKACGPDGGLGLWIRHTVHKRPGEEPTGSIWFTLFDRGAPAPRATKLTVPASGLSAPAAGWIDVAVPGAGGPVGAEAGSGRAEIGPGRGEGAVDTEALAASWSLRFGGGDEPCRYLPADWLYEAPLPRTKFVAPFPDAVFDGTLEVGGASLEIAGWPGMIGHNWGTEHAERWVWIEGTGFADAPDAWFDVGAARIKLGPKITPWVPAGMLALDGVRHRLGGLGAIRSARIEESPTACSFSLPGKDIVVHGRVEAPQKDFVGWLYADPKGGEHHTVNC